MRKPKIFLVIHFIHCAPPNLSCCKPTMCLWSMEYVKAASRRWLCWVTEWWHCCQLVCSKNKVPISLVSRNSLPRVHPYPDLVGVSWISWRTNVMVPLESGDDRSFVRALVKWCLPEMKNDSQSSLVQKFHAEKARTVLQRSSTKAIIEENVVNIQCSSFLIL